MGEWRPVGLTGGVGSGKSTAAAEFAALGAHVIDLDALSRSVLAEDRLAIETVFDHFGDEVVAGNCRAAGFVDREALGRIVFADAAERAFLEQVVLSRVEVMVGARTREIRERHGDGAVILHDSPLLVEKGKAADYAAVIVVTNTLESRLARLEGRGWSREKSLAVMKAQASDAERAAVADFVIDNSDTLEELRSRVAEVWGALAR
ncbi:dephospho-CoA kinase [Micrococcales bacterium 31B]|nr:dephospho-CoA kinase [Micrococcales bacterium 31B]